jgi:hypothetical protein
MARSTDTLPALRVCGAPSALPMAAAVAVRPSNRTSSSFRHSYTPKFQRGRGTSCHRDRA